MKENEGKNRLRKAKEGRKERMMERKKEGPRDRKKGLRTNMEKPYIHKRNMVDEWV